MSSNRSDSDTDCDLNPLEDLEDGTNDKISDEPAQPAAVDRGRASDDDRHTKLWDIFDKIPGERGIASCRLCHRRLSYKTTSANLKKHLHHMHALEVDAGILPSSKVKSSEKIKKRTRRAERKEEKESDTDLPNPRPYRSKSLAWKYFSIACRSRRRARCKLCAKVLSYATTVTNLLTHLERRHNNVHLEESGQLVPTPISPLWAYFKCLDEAMQLACCLICKKRVDYSDDCSELRRHLVRKHPNVDLDESSTGKTFMVTDSGDLFEIDVNKAEPVAAESDNEENEPFEADYLDDTAYDETEEIIKEKPKQNLPSIRILTQKKLKQQPEFLELSKPKEVKEEPDDSIDIFGKYIVSLLKMMNKNTSNKLQYQILKQIFEAQSEEMTVKDNNVTSNSEQSPVIINNDHE